LEADGATESCHVTGRGCSTSARSLLFPELPDSAFPLFSDRKVL